MILLLLTYNVACLRLLASVKPEIEYEKKTENKQKRNIKIN